MVVLEKVETKKCSKLGIVCAFSTWLLSGTVKALLILSDLHKLFLNAHVSFIQLPPSQVGGLRKSMLSSCVVGPKLLQFLLNIKWTMKKTAHYKLMKIRRVKKRILHGIFIR